MFGFSTILTAIVYPISTHWCWGDGGWLSSRGFYDFAGSGVVHVSGGVHALVGKIMILRKLALIYKFEYRQILYWPLVIHFRGNNSWTKNRSL